MMKKVIYVLILAVLLVVSIVMSVKYVNMRNKLLESNTYLYKNVKAIEDAGFEAKEQKDGSYKLVERTEPIERTDD